MFNEIKIFLLTKEYKQEKEKRESCILREAKINKDFDNLKNNCKKGDKDIKDYNQAFNNYLNFQENQRKKIDLIKLGSLVENGFNKFGNNSRQNKKNIKSSSKNVFEGFQNNNKIIKNSNNKINKNNKKKMLEEETLDEETMLEEETIEEEDKSVNKLFKNKTNNELNDDDEMDESIIKYIKELSKNIVKYIIKYYNIYFKKTINLDKLFQDNETMISGGILFIIISMGLYFIDITN